MKNLTRRDFLLTTSAATLAAAASPSFAAPRAQRVFIGSNTPDGILAFDWNPATAELTAAGVAAKIPNADDAKFQKAAADAKAGCPVSRVLNAEITLDAKLV